VRAAELVGAGLTYAQAGAVVGRSERTVTRWLQDPQLRALAAREAAGAGELGPVEVLRGALAATRASGQPDWPTRLAAARALAALRPQELEPEQSGPGLEQPEPSIIVYDLPPGATPVLHRARAGAKAESSPDGAGADGAPDGAGAPGEQLPSAQHVFMYQTAEGELETASVRAGDAIPAACPGGRRTTAGGRRS
jgi:hypothetical protein